ncbi:E3 ubiquitin-protein ligase BRE1-like 2 isoform X2 [Spinacia oleracea]|uniref:E3 ubiquitin-protein ligase BRE1-like 2 isoform X2 n=1 Tax=Spinacia oleracea TaxID=3562 RepID=A0ABM3REU3_SPIOL|nr:E3 ubiquitin-protein ligase BRE1-like 2 isoform X2 [Spinacia oleracea]
MKNLSVHLLSPEFKEYVDEDATVGLEAFSRIPHVVPMLSVNLKVLQDLIAEDANSIQVVIDGLRQKHSEHANKIQSYIQNQSVDETEIKYLQAGLSKKSGGCVFALQDEQLQATQQCTQSTRTTILMVVQSMNMKQLIHESSPLLL